MANKVIPNTRKTKLSPEQLERVQNLAGEGKATTFEESGVVSLKAMRGLAKARKKAGRFVLYTNVLGKYIFVAREQPDANTAPLTTNLDEALEFYEGFDNPESKARNWEKALEKFTPIILSLKHAKRYGKNQIKEQ